MKKSIKVYKDIVILGIALIATLILYFWFLNTPYYSKLEDWGAHHTAELVVILFLVKVIGLVWPALPGGFFIIISIPLLGWFNGYLIDFFATLVGASIDFYIARRWGLTFLRKYFAEDTVKMMQRIKFKKERQIESVIAIQLIGNFVAEIVYYAVGLFDIKYRNYLIATAITAGVIGLPTYYFAHNIISGNQIVINGMPLIIGAILLFYFRHRYFDIEDKD